MTSQAHSMENGIVIGSVESRFPPTFNSWWGHISDNRPDSQTDLNIAIAGTTISAA